MNDAKHLFCLEDIPKDINDLATLIDNIFRINETNYVNITDQLKVMIENGYMSLENLLEILGHTCKLNIYRKGFKEMIYDILQKLNIDINNPRNYIHNLYMEEQDPDELISIIYADDVDTFVNASDSFDIEDTNDGKRIIDVTARFGAVKIFKYLYQQKVLITPSTVKNAFIGNNFEIIHMCEHAAKITQECMDKCIKYHHIDTVIYLAENYDLKVQFKDCAKFHNLSIILNELVKTGDINYVDINGDNAILQLCRKGYDKVVQFFIEKGINVNHESKKGESAAYFATFYNQPSVLRLLARNGVSIDKLFYLGSPLFFHACLSGSMGIIKVFDEYIPADFYTSFDSENSCALIKAIQSGNFETIKYVIEKGADIKNVYLQNPDELKDALQKSLVLPEIVKLLIDKGIDFDIMKLAHEDLNFNQMFSDS